jgi:hypothetical protein
MTRNVTGQDLFVIPGPCFSTRLAVGLRAGGFVFERRRALDECRAVRFCHGLSRWLKRAVKKVAKFPNLTETLQLTSWCSALTTRKMQGLSQAIWSSDVRELRE